MERVELLELLTKFGDYLHGVDTVRELNGIGFNKFDHSRWLQVRGTEKSIHLLYKYGKQLQQVFGDEAIQALKECPKIPMLRFYFENNTVAIINNGLMPSFNAYKDLCKGSGCWWDGVNRNWFVPTKLLRTFDFDGFSQKMIELGFEVSAFKMPEIKEEKLTVDRAAQLLQNRQLDETVIVKRLANGAFAFAFSYSPILNELFSNKAGKISGIVEYIDPERAAQEGKIAHSRETFQIELVQEIIEKIRTVLPNWKILMEGVEEAVAERNLYVNELQKPIPEVAAKLAEGISLFAFQNEGVRFFQRGSGLLGDEMGCIDGDAVISVNRANGTKKMKLSKLFYKFHGGKSRNKTWDLNIPTRISSMNSDGQLVLNTVKDVLYKGKKAVILLTIKTKTKTYKIKLTPDHELFTGEKWVEAQSLSVGDTVVVNGVKWCGVCKDKTEHVSYKYSKFFGLCKKCVYTFHRKNKHSKEGVIDKDGYVRIVSKMKKHPRYSSGGVYKHIIIFEAHKNGLTFNEYLRRIHFNELDNLWFVPTELSIHHKDGNKQNNSLRNLELLTKKEHALKHNPIKKLTKNWVHEAKVISIKAAGECDVYDVVMDGPLHNFVANGVVVHNCGKTIQSLAFVAGWDHRVLVVCPKVVRRTWINEAKKFFPTYFTEFNSIELVTKNLRKHGQPDLSNVNIASVNYESLPKFKEAILAAGFDTLIIDESHRMMNRKTITCSSIYDIAPSFKHIFGLSGTAIKNKKHELFTQLDLIRPGLFESKEELKMATIGGTWNKIQECYLARQKSQVLKFLPAKLTQIIELEADEKIADYNPLEPLMIDEISRLKADVAKGKAKITAQFVQELLDSSEDSVLVFSDSVDAAKEIYSLLGPDQALLHYGQLSDDTREDLKAKFQDPTTKQRAFVSTRQSLAVGATLTRANLVVFNDCPYTAADLRQSEDRTHRVGQTKSVNVYWMTIAGNNWDKKITGIIKKKYELNKKLNAGLQLTEEEREWMSRSVSIDDIRKALGGVE